MIRALFLIVLFISQQVFGQTPQVCCGRIEHLDKFPSRFIQPRNIDIWLPEQYDKNEFDSYAVIYMHDGQMLFDSSITWNHQEWNIDEMLSLMIDNQKVSKAIVVGISNGGAERHSEFCPQQPFETLEPGFTDSLIDYAKRSNGNQIFSGAVKSDQYLKFLVKELKPYIDKKYRTIPDRSHTFIAGSSMGGLISLYAICEYPKIFGAAACISTHWPVLFTAENNPFPDAIFRYMKKKLPSPKNHRIYFDYGTETLDAIYKPFQEQADEIMKLKGYDEKNWVTREYIGADHSEKSWSARMDVVFRFLMRGLE
jgi:predicted alpha/beta superfamily hydrolase